MATTNPWDLSGQSNPNMNGGLITQNSTPTASSAVPGTVSNTDGTTFNSVAPATMAPAGYMPTQRTVDPTKETVQGQFNSITQSDSPVMQMARTGAKQQMNAKGLLNSSMAVGAADAAAYQAALPMAQADANIYGTVSQQNQAFQNEALKTNTASMNDASKTNMTAWSDAAKANMDSATKTQLATIEADYKTTMQNSATASEMYKQTVKNISDIFTNKDMTADAKNKAVQNQLYMMKSGFNIAGAIGNMDLGSLLNFSAAPTA